MYADVAAFVASSLEGLLTTIDKFAGTIKLFSMSIYVKKIVDDAGLTSISSLNAEISVRIGKAVTTFGRLRARI